MNKLEKTKRSLMRTGVVAGFLVVSAVAGYQLIRGMYEKVQAEQDALTASVAQIRSAMAALDQEMQVIQKTNQRFAELPSQVVNKPMHQDLDALKVTLRDARNHYRFGKVFKVQLAPDVLAKIPNFPHDRYTLNIRKGVVIELEAMSDVHLYSFLDAIQKQLPGFVRYADLEVTRRLDMQEDAYRQMSIGQLPMLISAKITFDWIGFQPLDAQKDAPL